MKCWHVALVFILAAGYATGSPAAKRTHPNKGTLFERLKGAGVAYLGSCGETYTCSDDAVVICGPGGRSYEDNS
ncbi:MAG TPA: hypothetical protein VHQ92_18330, partial [Pseudolabrys sp.]|nr:hypothetical protein [Pseudolabrys sp.]